MNSNYELDLISRTLNSESVVCQNEVNKEIIKLRTKINSSYKKLVEEGSFPEKAKTIEDLNGICDTMESYIRYSMFIGKTVVGIMVDSVTSRKKLMKDIIGLDEKNFNIDKNTLLPAIYLNGSPGLFSVNKFDLISPISELDAQVMFDNLVNKRKIDLSQGIQAIINTQPIKYEDIVFIVFPSFGDKYSKFFKELIYMTDFMVLCGSNKLQISLNYLSNINYKQRLFLKTDDIKILNSRNLNIKTFDEIILQNENRFRYNVYFNSMLDNILLNQVKYYLDKNKILENEIIALRKAMLIDQDDNDELKKLRKASEKALNKNKQLLNKIEDVEDEIFNISENIIELIKSVANIEDDKNIDEKREKLYYDRATKLIDTQYYEEAEKTINLFKSQRNIKGNLLSLKLNKVRNIKLDEHDLYRLYNDYSSDEEMLKAKVEFRRELNISENNVIELVNSIKKLTNKEEFYIKAKYLKTKDLKLSKKYFRLGAEQNHEECKSELYTMYLNNEDIRDMEYLARLLYDEANYYLAQYYKNTKYYRHVYHLKIAAALGNLPAKNDLARIYYHKNNFENAITILRELIEARYEEQNCLLNLGMCYYKLEQYQKATDVLEKCKNERAYYLLGEVYEYGKGRMKDLKKSMDYYKKSSDMGNPKAKTKYLKINSRLEKINMDNETRTGNYSSSSSYSSYSSSSSSTSTGWCFITTATCRALGKKDDCEEILRFKDFRDRYIIKEDDGEDLVAKYYSIAPDIVRKIDSREDYIEVYNSIWDSYLGICNKLIIDGDYKRAKYKYIEMVEFLSKR